MMKRPLNLTLGRKAAEQSCGRRRLKRPTSHGDQLSGSARHVLSLGGGGVVDALRGSVAEVIVVVAEGE